MISPNRYVKEISPYKVTHSLEKISKFKGKVFKLDWNESTIPPSQKVMRQIKQFLESKNHLNWYADPSSKDLQKEIAKYTNCSENQILVTNGSDSAHELICNTYLEEGDEVILPVPTYSNFLIWPKTRGANIIKVPYSIGQRCDINQVVSKINQKTKIIYLINPYICTYNINDVKKVVEASKDALVIIDEAYHEFYGKSCINLVKEFDNVIITRSFSKALSIAGLRLGYILANKNIINDLSKIHSFKSVNILAQITGKAILKDINFVGNYAKEVKKSLDFLAKELPKINFSVVQTNAGFILFKHKTIKKDNLKDKLEKIGIFVRDLGAISQTQEYLRMNVGTLSQTRDLVRLMIKYFSIKAIFLDRDGTIVEEPSGPNIGDDVIDEISKLRLLPNALIGLKKMMELGYTIFIISNQDGINRGRLTIELYNQMNAMLTKNFSKESIAIEKWLVCPHTPEERCICRKPKIGMLNSINKSYYLDFKNCYVIGDRDSDVVLAKNLKAKSILIKRNEVDYSKTKTKPNFKANDVYDACRFLKKLNAR